MKKEARNEIFGRLEKERYKRKRVFILFLFWAQK